jgi:hypothetical protein
MPAVVALVLLQIDRFYRPGPSPGPYIALMVLGFAVGTFGHIVRSRIIVGVGIAMIFLATVLLPLQHAGDFLD